MNLANIALSRKYGRKLSEGVKAELEIRHIMPRIQQRHVPLQLDTEIRFFTLCGIDHYVVITKGGRTMAYHRDDPSEPTSTLSTITERSLFMHYNHWTDSLMIFYASAMDYPERTLRVRVIPLDQIKNNTWQANRHKSVAPLLTSLVLPYPGFFDLSTPDHVFLVWNEDKGNSHRRHMAAYSLRTYAFAFHVSDSGQDTDFRFTKESVTMLRVRLQKSPDSEDVPICPDAPDGTESPPVHISISHLSKVDGKKVHQPVHLRFLKDLGKITFLEEYNRFLLIKQEFGNLLVIDMVGWISQKKLVGNCIMHPCKNWFPKNVSYMQEAHRFVCLVEDELQVWRLGPELGTFGCIFHLSPLSFALQSVRIFGMEHGVFFYMRHISEVGSFGEVRSLADDCPLIGTIHDDACTLEVKPLCYANPHQFMLFKYCPLRREVYISYDNVIYSWSATGK